MFRLTPDYSLSFPNSSRAIPRNSWHHLFSYWSVLSLCQQSCASLPTILKEKKKAREKNLSWLHACFWHFDSLVCRKQSAASQNIVDCHWGACPLPIWRSVLCTWCHSEIPAPCHCEIVPGEVFALPSLHPTRLSHCFCCWEGTVTVTLLISCFPALVAHGAAEHMVLPDHIQVTAHTASCVLKLLQGCSVFPWHQSSQISIPCLHPCPPSPESRPLPRSCGAHGGEWGAAAGRTPRSACWAAGAGHSCKWHWAAGWLLHQNWI